MAYTDTDEGLGISFGTAISAGGGITKTIGGLFAKDKNAGRLDGNAKAYAQALVNPTAPFAKSGETRQPTVFLLEMSRAWATDVAKKDAAAKYASAVSQLRAKGWTVDSATGRVSGGPKGATTAKPATTAKFPVLTAGVGGPVIGGMSLPPLLIAGAAAAGLYFLMNRR
jgi:hypothetical protein